MPKTKNKSYTLHMVTLPVVVLIAVAFLGSYYLSQGTTEILQEGEVVLSKTSNRGKGSANVAGKDNSNKGQSEKAGKPDKTETAKAPKGQNAAIYKKNIEDVVENLDAVVEDETLVGNTEVAEEIDEVADSEIEDADETADVIGQIESRNKWRTMLVGADYKNLGQLRSQLVRNENNIRKLTKNMDGTAAQGSEDAVQEQLQTMVQERERIKAVIQEHEGEFSLLGWVTKFLTGYTADPVDDAEEEEFIEEIEEVVEESTSPDNFLEVE